MAASILPSYKGRNVVVTGGRGYIGAPLVESLRHLGANVRFVSRSPGAAQQDDALVADIAKPEPWKEIVAWGDVIFHLAGNTSVYEASKDSAKSLEASVRPLSYLAHFARDQGRQPRVLFASTATVYGLTDVLPVAETTPARPITTYDLHKRFAEQELELASDCGILDATSLRLTNVYGPSLGRSFAAERGVLNKVTSFALDGKDLRLYGGGEFTRDYVYIDDVVRAFLMLGSRPGSGQRLFNVGTGSGKTVREAFNLVADLTAGRSGRRVNVLSVPLPDDVEIIDTRNFVASIEALKSACGWKPLVSLENGIKTLIESFP